MDKKNKIEFKGKYLSAIGTRKTASAQIRLYKNGQGLIAINGKKINEYFPTVELKKIITKPLQLAGMEKSLDFSIIVKGGGRRSQAEALRHGISLSLVKLDKELKPILKAEKLITRDSRKKERKKPGLKKARKAEQWSKR